MARKHPTRRKAAGKAIGQAFADSHVAAPAAKTPAAKTAAPKSPAAKTPAASRPSALVDTRIVYCGDCLEQLQRLPDGCV